MKVNIWYVYTHYDMIHSICANGLPINTNNDAYCCYCLSPSLSLRRSSILSIQFHVCITYVHCLVLHDPQQPQMLSFSTGQSSLSLFSYLPLVFNVHPCS